MQITDHDSHVFYVTAQGYAGDHWYSWFSKALNIHPELFVYLANEGSRPKYFAERSRSDRPDILTYTKFLSDVGRTYQGVGDCFSYRAHKMQRLTDTYGDRVRWVNLVRHPYAWLFFYTRWRAANMRMESGQTKPLDHEWNIVQHDLYKGLRTYEKKDVEIWAFYRGLTFLNDHIMKDLATKAMHVPLESLVFSKEKFKEIVSYLTHDRVEFNPQQLNEIYQWIYTPFRGEEKIHAKPEYIKSRWQDWQQKAFESTVSQEARMRFKDIGYEL